MWTGKEVQTSGTDTLTAGTLKCQSWYCDFGLPGVLVGITCWNPVSLFKADVHLNCGCMEEQFLPWKGDCATYAVAVNLGPVFQWAAELDPTLYSFHVRQQFTRPAVDCIFLECLVLKTGEAMIDPRNAVQELCYLQIGKLFFTSRHCLTQTAVLIFCCNLQYFKYRLSHRILLL